MSRPSRCADAAAGAGVAAAEADAMIYLDHHATTPCDPRVVDAMLPYFSEIYGNPAAVNHPAGKAASGAVEDARWRIARFLGCDAREIVFTSGATESNNMVLQALARSRGRHVVTSAIEHKSVSQPLERLGREGIEVTVLPVDAEGFVDPDDLSSVLRDDTSLVTIQAANGEIGTIEPIERLASIAHERGVPFHTDATQAIGKIDVSLDAWPVDLLSMSAHKLYGPKGIGLLFVRSSVAVDPLLHGGGQEKGRRSGTVNVPGVVGLARALELRASEMEDEENRLAVLRDRLAAEILKTISGTFVNGSRTVRLPGNLNVTFEGLDAEEIMFAMRRFALSSGSACSTGEREPSPVLIAIGLSEAQARGSIRFGLGRETGDEDIDLLIDDLRRTIPKLRKSAI